LDWDWTELDGAAMPVAP